MKRPGWLGGGSGEAKDPEPSETEAPELAPTTADGEGEKVSVPFGKPPPAGPKPKAPKRRPRVVKPQPEPKPAEDASRRAERRRRARAAKRPAGEGGRKRRAPAARAKAAEARGAVTSTLREGTEETRKRTRGAAPGAAAGLLQLLGALFAVFFDIVGFVLNLAIGLATLLAGPGRALLERLRRVLDRLSLLLTPARALAIAAAGAAVLLGLSQFADYHSITISTDAYSAVATVAPPPEIERVAAGDPHAYAFVPVAAVALLLLALALRGRWKACRLIALGGIAAIVVGLLVDRPAGLDAGDAVLKFDGAEGRLLGGFYAQLFSGLLLTVTSLLLARELRLEASPRPARAPRAARSGQRLRLPRGRRGTEEARA